MHLDFRAHQAIEGNMAFQEIQEIQETLYLETLVVRAPLAVGG